MDFIERMKAEASELSTKLEAGKKFLKSPPPSISGLEEIMLAAQLSAMDGYLGILKARIAFYEKG